MAASSASADMNGFAQELGEAKLGNPFWGDLFRADLKDCSEKKKLARVAKQIFKRNSPKLNDDNLQVFTNLLTSQLLPDDKRVDIAKFVGEHFSDLYKSREIKFNKAANCLSQLLSAKLDMLNSLIMELIKDLSYRFSEQGDEHKLNFLQILNTLPSSAYGRLISCTEQHDFQNIPPKLMRNYESLKQHILLAHYFGFDFKSFFGVPLHGTHAKLMRNAMKDVMDQYAQNYSIQSILQDILKDLPSIEEKSINIEAITQNVITEMVETFGNIKPRVKENYQSFAEDAQKGQFVVNILGLSRHIIGLGYDDEFLYYTNRGKGENFETSGCYQFKYLDEASIENIIGEIEEISSDRDYGERLNKAIDYFKAFDQVSFHHLPASNANVCGWHSLVALAYSFCFSRLNKTLAQQVEPESALEISKISEKIAKSIYRDVVSFAQKDQLAKFMNDIEAYTQHNNETHRAFLTALYERAKYKPRVALGNESLLNKFPEEIVEENQRKEGLACLIEEEKPLELMTLYRRMQKIEKEKLKRENEEVRKQHESELERMRKEFAALKQQQPVSDAATPRFSSWCPIL